MYINQRRGARDVRSGDDDLSVHQLLVKGRVLAVLVGGGDQSVALVLDPLPQAQLILDGTEKTRLLLGVLTTLLGLAFWTDRWTEGIGLTS